MTISQNKKVRARVARTVTNVEAISIRFGFVSSVSERLMGCFLSATDVYVGEEYREIFRKSKGNLPIDKEKKG